MKEVPTKPQRRTMALVKGRVSSPLTRYFITLCATQRNPKLTITDTAVSIMEIIKTVFSGKDADLLCATLMPMHLHLLFTLGRRLTLDRLLAKFKTLTRKALPDGIAWQRNFFEHRLRPQELANDYARYIFLNPYRAELIGRLTTWPYWMKGESADFDFLHLLEDGQFPPKEWIEAGIAAPGLSGEYIGHD